jgi:AcrR family transcriptional regulator
MTSQSLSDAEILQTAVSLLRENALTMSALAKASGLSRSTLYRRFGSKSELLARLAGTAGAVAPEPAADTQTRILEAARRLFVRHGFHQPTIAAIAAEAGVGEATVYRLFQDRETLLQTAVSEFSPRLHPDEIAASGDLRADLSAIVAALLTAMRDNRDLIRLGLSPGEHTVALLSRLRPAQERTRNRIAAYLATQIDAGELRPGDPADWAAALLGMALAFAVVLPVHYGRPLDDVSAAAAVIVDLFLQGARSPESPASDH